MPDRSAVEQARVDGLLREIFDQRIRFNHWLGLRVHSLTPAGPQLAFDMRDELIGNFVQGRLHGGMIAATLDTVGGLAVAVAIAEKHKSDTAEQIGHRFNRVGTIDMRVDYLRPGMGRSFVATGRVIRLGGRIASVQMTLENDDGETIATGTAAYVIT
ncbi:MAG: thioesterase family protein [Rhodocyclales bacterium]|nr:thioesterase family protein [Rhodocyclales bacterium]